MQLPVYNQQGQKVSVIDASDSLFKVPVNAAVIHQAAVAQQANARRAIAHTKMRGEVRGGGKKPWRQKGTGRARHGSIRSPLWRGGGIVFGPRSERNFAKKINRKVRRAALLMALSDKAASSALVILDTLAPKERKVKAMAMILKALPLKRGGTLIALPQAEKATKRLTDNLRYVTPIWVGSLNIVDLLKNANLITTVEGVKEIEKIYGPR